MEIKLLLDEHGKQREIPLPPTVFTIGRGSKCHLRMHCPAVSKLHCAIASWAGKVTIRDLKSRNGTFVNDRRVESEVRLSDRDVLRIGTVVFQVKIQDDEYALPVSVMRPNDVKWLMDASGRVTPAGNNETQSYQVNDLLQDDDALEQSPETLPFSAGELMSGLFRRKQ